jgi:iron(III)-enterobactin esterase
MTTNQSRVFPGTDPTFAGAECHGPTPGECCHKASPPSPCGINWERLVSVYVPAAYVDGTAAPLLLMQDGPGWLTQVAYALDNLVASGDANRTLPPFVAISVENGGSDAIKSERGLEYDTMSDRYARFISEEVLPAVLADPSIHAAFPRLAFAAAPAQRATFGCSSGAAAALTMAWFRPDLFGRVAAYSATLVDQQVRGCGPGGDAFNAALLPQDCPVIPAPLQDHDDRTGAFAANPLGAWGYHSGTQLISETSQRPLRVFHHGSEFDLGWNLTPAPVNSTLGGLNNTAGDPGNWTDGHHNWLAAANRTAAALGGAGYPFRHVFSLDTQHCDPKVILQTLADTLVWLWYDD